MNMLWCCIQQDHPVNCHVLSYMNRFGLAPDFANDDRCNHESALLPRGITANIWWKLCINMINFSPMHSLFLTKLLISVNIPNLWLRPWAPVKSYPYAPLSAYEFRCRPLFTWGRHRCFHRRTRSIKSWKWYHNIPQNQWHSLQKHAWMTSVYRIQK